MNRCPRCGAHVWPYQAYCTNCGADLRTVQPVNQAVTASNPVLIPSASPIRDASGRSIPYFVWSLILFLCFNPLGTPLAIGASFCCSRAHAGDSIERNIRTARLLCILSTIITGGTLLMIVVALITRLAV